MLSTVEAFLPFPRSQVYHKYFFSNHGCFHSNKRLLLSSFVLFHRFQEVIKQILRILGAAGGFGVELGGEERLGFVLNTFAGTVVQVLEQHRPFSGQRVGIQCEAVVLRGDIATLGTGKQYGLVVAAVAVFELERVAARGKTHQLVA